MPLNESTRSAVNVKRESRILSAMFPRRPKAEPMAQPKGYQAYPKMLYHAELEPVVVQDEAAKDAAIAQGFYDLRDGVPTQFAQAVTDAEKPAFFKRKKR
jgi:hypothetical protein